MKWRCLFGGARSARKTRARATENCQQGDTAHRQSKAAQALKMRQGIWSQYMLRGLLSEGTRDCTQSTLQLAEGAIMRVCSYMGDEPGLRGAKDDPNKKCERHANGHSAQMIYQLRKIHHISSTSNLYIILCFRSQEATTLYTINNCRASAFYSTLYTPTSLYQPRASVPQTAHAHPSSSPHTCP